SPCAVAPPSAYNAGGAAPRSGATHTDFQPCQPRRRAGARQPGSGAGRDAIRPSGTGKLFQQLPSPTQSQRQQRAVMHIGGPQYLGDIQLDGIFRDPQFAGYLVVGQPLGQQLGHLHLSGRELGVTGQLHYRYRLGFRLRGQAADTLLQLLQRLRHLPDAFADQLDPDSGGAPPNPSLQPLYTSQQGIQIQRLLMIIGYTGAQGGDDILLVRITGEQNAFEGTLAGGFLQLMDELDAIHFRHSVIAEHHTDMFIVVEASKGFSGADTTDTVDVVAFTQINQFLNNERLVVHDQNLAWFYSSANDSVLL